jgi:hypothetical protein
MTPRSIHAQSYPQGEQYSASPRTGKHRQEMVSQLLRLGYDTTRLFMFTVRTLAGREMANPCVGGVERGSNHLVSRVVGTGVAAGTWAVTVPEREQLRRSESMLRESERVCGATTTLMFLVTSGGRLTQDLTSSACSMSPPRTAYPLSTW